MICPNPTCRTDLTEDAAFCHRCGWALRDSAAQPREPAAVVAVDSDRRFPIVRADSLIGRYDAASPPFPDIDLNDVDPERTVSRHHARIVLREGQYFLRLEDEARNPGEMDGAPLVKGVWIALRSGDVFTLGLVVLRFEEGVTDPKSRWTITLGDGQ